jgi:hypothetical protein
MGVNTIIRNSIDAEKKRNYNFSSKGEARPNQAQKGVE